LTCERGAEIYFLFVNSSAAGDQSRPIVERIGEFSDATIRPRGSFVDVGGVLHSESFMRTLVVKLTHEGIELGLLLKVRASLPGHQSMAVHDGVDIAASGYSNIVGQLA
jgi:hypothetical protein